MICVDPSGYKPAFSRLEEGASTLCDSGFSVLLESVLALDLTGWS
jgi:hypothetical protein